MLLKGFVCSRSYVHVLYIYVLGMVGFGVYKLNTHNKSSIRTKRENGDQGKIY
jgi:hypothetical protein